MSDPTEDDTFELAFVGGLLHAGPDEAELVRGVLADVRDADVDPPTRGILQAVRAMSARGDDLSDPAVWAASWSGEDLDRVAELEGMVPDTSRLRAHADKLIERRRQRRVAALAHELANGNLEPSVREELRTALDGFSSGGRFTILSSPQFEAQPESDRLFGSTMTEGDIAMLFGASGAGKSFIALDLAMGVAAGTTTVLGPSSKRGVALVVAAEGQGGLRKRIRAYRAAHGLATTETTNLLVLPHAIAMVDEEEVTALADSIHRALDGRPLEMLVLDTVRMTIGANAAFEEAAMLAYVHACKRIQRRYGCTVLTVHHTRKNMDEPSGDWKGQCDSMVRVKAEGHGGGQQMILETVKLKDGDTQAPVPLVFEANAGWPSVVIRRRDYRRSIPLAERILSFARGKPGCSTRDVIAAMDVRDGEVNAKVLELLQSGHLKDIGSGQGRKLVVTTDYPVLGVA